MEAFDRLDVDRGRQWDPEVVDAFLALYAGTGRTAQVPKLP